jgi:hypothetical protein
MKDSPRHYERVFDRYLRARRVPHVCVDEARRLLLPVDRPAPSSTLKFFDYVIYGGAENLLVELKGRRLGASTRGAGGAKGVGLGPSTRLECWITLDDLTSLQRWEALFGPPFAAVILFVYWCEVEPPGALFQEVFEVDDRWYALRAVRMRDYAAHMRVRSPRWRTIDLLQADFERISHPFAPTGDGTPHPLPESKRLVKSLLPTLESPPPALPDIDRLLPAR